MNKAEANRINGRKGGRPKGTKSQATLEKEAVLKEFRQRVMRNAQRILDAQMSLAQGVQYLYKITTFKNGTKSKPELITDTSTIEAYLDGEYGDGASINDEQEFYFITTERPDNKAIDSMLDRTLGKAKNELDVTSGGDKLVFMPQELLEKHDTPSSPKPNSQK